MKDRDLREQVLDAIAADEGEVDAKKIARALRLKGAERKVLARVLRALEREGAIAQRRPSRRGDGPPAVGVVLVDKIDDEGELWARWPARAEDERPGLSLRLESEGGRRAPRPGDRALARIGRGDDGLVGHVLKILPQFSGKIVGVLERAAAGLVLRSSDRRKKVEARVRPSDAQGAEPGDLVAAELLPDRGLEGPRAKVIERLGAPDDPKAVSLSAAIAAELRIDFPEAALAQAEAARPAELSSRHDLRDLDLVTIDGEDARDFDDAVWAEARAGGGYQIVVAIADVAHYVRPGDALDREAKARGNSVYFPDRVLPMLPEALSNGLCSLRPDEDRACLACRMTIDENGALGKARFVRGLMRSRARLTYEEVEAARPGGETAESHPLAATIASLYEAFALLDAARGRRGALDLDLPERVVVLDQAGSPSDVRPRRRLASHRLIEEFMILANVAAARALIEKSAIALFRVHDRPEALRVQALGDLMRALGLKSPANLRRARDFAGLLAPIDDPSLRELVSNHVLRTQAQAVYQPENIGHFGLALERYAHFTSPIRRYADLTVHRGLIAAFDLGEGGSPFPSLEEAERLGEDISSAERKAMDAERRCAERFTALFLEGRVGSAFHATAVGAHKAGLFVRLRDTGAEGLVPMAALGRDFFHVDDNGSALVGESTGLAYAAGDALEVELTACDPITGALTFAVLDHKPGPLAAAAKKTGRRRGGGAKRRFGGRRR